MSSEAKGQVGGLDMNEEARKSLAKESREFTCAGCGGRRNEEIMADCEALWREQQTDGSADRQPQVEIPEELRLAYKDDMDRGPPTPNIAMTQPLSSIAGRSRTLAQLETSPRAGPVVNLLARSKPPPSPLRTSATASGSSASLDLDQIPATSSLRRTTTNHDSGILETPRSGIATATVPRRRSHNLDEDTVPGWVDKAIVGLLVALVLIFLRKIIF